MCQLIPIVYREKDGREVTHYSVYPCKETIDAEWEEAKAFLRRNDKNGKLPWEYNEAEIWPPHDELQCGDNHCSCSCFECS